MSFFKNRQAKRMVMTVRGRRVLFEKCDEKGYSGNSDLSRNLSEKRKLGCKTMRESI